MMHTIYHTVCGQPAFKYLIEPKPRARIKIDHAVRLDGGPFVPGAVQYCGTCQMGLSAADLMPGPPVYDMTSQEDMNLLYGEN